MFILVCVVFFCICVLRINMEILVKCYFVVVLAPEQITQCSQQLPECKRLGQINIQLFYEHEQITFLSWEFFNKNGSMSYKLINLLFPLYFWHGNSWNSHTLLIPYK